MVGIKLLQQLRIQTLTLAVFFNGHKNAEIGELKCFALDLANLSEVLGDAAPTHMKQLDRLLISNLFFTILFLVNWSRNFFEVQITGINRLGTKFEQCQFSYSSHIFLSK